MFENVKENSKFEQNLQNGKSEQKLKNVNNFLYTLNNFKIYIEHFL